MATKKPNKCECNKGKKCTCGSKCDCNKPATKSDLVTTTKKVNGGTLTTGKSKDGKLQVAQYETQDANSYEFSREVVYSDSVSNKGCACAKSPAKKAANKKK